MGTAAKIMMHIHFSPSKVFYSYGPEIPVISQWNSTIYEKYPDRNENLEP